MSKNKIVSLEEWTAARLELRAKEKELTQLRDQLAEQRCKLPWTQVAKEYFFDGESGKISLAEMFGACSQLIVYHFMFDPEWTEGCKSCSLIADHYDRLIVHLQQRDVAMVTVARAPLDKLMTFRERMGWNFQWVSSSGTDFNHDYQVTFTQKEIEQGNTYYNYETKPFPLGEAPGMSVFAKNEQNEIFHTYSAYARELETFLGIYRLLDIVPKGRDEADLSYGMEWVRHHDRYGDETFVDPYVQIMPEYSNS